MHVSVWTSVTRTSYVQIYMYARIDICISHIYICAPKCICMNECDAHLICADTFWHTDTHLYILARRTSLTLIQRYTCMCVSVWTSVTRTSYVQIYMYVRIDICISHIYICTYEWHVRYFHTEMHIFMRTYIFICRYMCDKYICVINMYVRINMCDKYVCAHKYLHLCMKVSDMSLICADLYVYICLKVRDASLLCVTHL